MTTWTVSRVALSHASQNIRNRRETTIVDDVDMQTTAEPELVLGIRLFWATILGITLVFLIPIMAGWMFRSASHRAPEMMAVPALVTTHIAPPIAPLLQELPKAQPPPPELLSSRLGHVALREGH